MVIASGMAVTFLVALTAIDMFWTPARIRAVERSINAGDPEARTSLYQITIGYLWPMAGIAALLLGVGFGGAAFGFRAPDFSHLHGIYAGVLVGSALGLIASFAATLWPRKGKVGPLQHTFDLLTPTTPRERRYFALVAITAGITEEIIYRALPFAMLALWWPGGDPRIYAVIVAVLFGLAHVYQGPAGMAATTLLGLLLGLIYAGTGSLLPCMVLHAVVDLRLLLARRR
ncbi:MAG TPA: CPBP family intramembrane glutamic endopeptidase [Kofleriaceae bacterium]|nr:CPBP family intramembrane glutamic endopeptidase [Kofleriaceae bacterium]